MSSLLDQRAGRSSDELIYMLAYESSRTREDVARFLTDKERLASSRRRRERALVPGSLADAPAPRPIRHEIAAGVRALRPSPPPMAGLPWVACQRREAIEQDLPAAGRPRPAPTPADRGAVRLSRPRLGALPGSLEQLTLAQT